MGVRGLQTFLCGNAEADIRGLPNGERIINMRDEIIRWKKINGGKSPIIVIDAMGIINLITKNEAELFCGGRSQQYYELFGNLFSELTSSGAKLVFFSDLNVQQSKGDQWLARRDREYELDRQLYDGIARGWSVSQILQSRKDSKALMTAKHALTTEGAKYGEYRHSTKHDCDAELAKYARDHNALAVIAYDSDFLIFEGYWEYWSAVDMNVDTFETKEYNRKGLRSHLGLSYEQLPLFATLMSNDHTTFHSEALRSFHLELGPLAQKWSTVPKYVRECCASAFTLSETEISQISERVFGSSSTLETQETIQNGIQSYNLDFIDSGETDPLLRKAVDCAEIYELLTSPIVPLNLKLYDMRDKYIVKSFTEIVADILMKSLGILWRQKNRKHTIELFGKWSHDERYISRTMKPIFPPKNFQPPLIELLFKDDANIDSAFNKLRWSLLIWLLSLPAKCLDRIKSVPTADRMVAVTLLFMLQQSQILPLEADVILITHAKVTRNEATSYSCPEYLIARYVHVAHLYGQIFRKIRLAFRVTGLGAFIDESFKFDGVVFHHLRTEFVRNPGKMDQYMPEIRQSRIYVN